MVLSVDSHLVVVPLIDEDAPSFVSSHNVETFDSGSVAAEMLSPDNNQVRILKFEGISGAEDLYSTTSIRGLLNYFASGGLMRVFRMYPSVVDPWSQTQVFGYSDIVNDAIGTMSYAWNDPAMSAFQFKLSGYEV